MRARTCLLAAAATVALTAASVTAVAATRDARASHGSWAGLSPGTSRGLLRGPAADSSCPLPRWQPGTRITVVLADMHGAHMMSGSSAMMGGPYDTDSMMGRPSMRRGAPMMLHASRRTVPAGAVSLVAVNHGARTHELVVLPLAAGAPSGARTGG